MNYVKAQHEGIFYPSGKIRQDALFSSLPHPEDQNIPSLQKYPAAIMVPQAAWTWSLSDIQTSLHACRELSDPALIVILAPLHAPIMDIHNPSFVFAPTTDGAETEQGTVQFPTNLISLLMEESEGTMGCQDIYFTEEPGVEYLYPVLARQYPAVPVLPLLTGSCDSPMAKHLAGVLKRITTTYPDTLFIVAGNLSGEMAPTLALTHARNLQDALENDIPLMALKAKGDVSSVAIPWLEALRRNLQGTWRLLSARQSDGPSLQQLPLEPDTDATAPVVWHAAEIYMQGPSV